MLMSPDTFYEIKLKGKNAAQIMTVIRGLKQEIGRLKNIVEHPDYHIREVVMCPSENTQIYCSRKYLERAKQALIEAGGEYIPSATERKGEEFEDNIPYIKKVVFSIGGFFSGYETKTYTIYGDKVHRHVEHSLILTPSNIGDGKIEPLDKDEFLAELEDLHIGEWRRNYNTRRFGFVVMDGTQWELNIYFSNGHKPVKISGDNAYPYNFERLLDLFEIEE